MKLIALFLFIFSFKAYSIESYNFSLIFGSANLTKVGEEQTYGSGLTLRTELFEDLDWGYLITGGVSQTQSDSFGNDSNKTKFEYRSNIVQGGAFLYFAKYFRVAGGLSYFHINEKQTLNTKTDKFEYHKFGPFYEIGGKYNFGNLVLGVDYVAHHVDNFKQSGLYLLVGFAI